jgi:hypothetical protein
MVLNLSSALILSSFGVIGAWLLDKASQVASQMRRQIAFCDVPITVFPSYVLLKY